MGTIRAGRGTSRSRNKQPVSSGELLGADALERYCAKVREAACGQPILFICIGSDRSTGDAFGPLVGSALRRAGIASVYGELSDPLDAVRLPQLLPELPPEARLFAIDASLTYRQELVGLYSADFGPLQPGRSLGSTFAPIGDYSLAGIVGVAGPKPYASLQSASLYHVMTMAEAAASAIIKQWGSPLLE